MQIYDKTIYVGGERSDGHHRLIQPAPRGLEVRHYWTMTTARAYP